MRAQTAEVDSADDAVEIKDSNGNVLQDVYTFTVIKDLKVKGASSVVKVGTKVNNIRLVDGDHDIDCKIDGIGAIQLKSQFVKKASVTFCLFSQFPPLLWLLSTKFVNDM